MTFAVELAERPGNWLHLATEPVRPAEVAAAIRAALARGVDFGGPVRLRR